VSKALKVELERLIEWHGKLVGRIIILSDNITFVANVKFLYCRAELRPGTLAPS
jgi:hypothetical protein